MNDFLRGLDNVLSGFYKEPGMAKNGSVELFHKFSTAIIEKSIADVTLSTDAIGYLLYYTAFLSRKIEEAKSKEIDVHSAYNIPYLDMDYNGYKYPMISYVFDIMIGHGVDEWVSETPTFESRVIKYLETGMWGEIILPIKGVVDYAKVDLFSTLAIEDSPAIRFVYTSEFPNVASNSSASTHSEDINAAANDAINSIKNCTDHSCNSSMNAAAFTNQCLNNNVNNFANTINSSTDNATCRIRESSGGGSDDGWDTAGKVVLGVAGAIALMWVGKKVTDWVCDDVNDIALSDSVSSGMSSFCMNGFGG